MTDYSFRCQDIGMKECNFEVRGSASKDEVLQIAAVHAKRTHNIDPIPPEVAQKVSAAIKS